MNKCCNAGSKGFIEKIGLSSCKEGEREIAELKAAGRCHYVGMWKEKLLNVVGGWKKHYSYCCYGSRIAKEINAQVRQDLGDPKNPNCSGFTVEELQSVDFEKLDFSFLSEEIKSKNLWSKMGDMKKAFEHTQHLMEGEIETIKSDVAGNNVLVDDQKLYEKNSMRNMMIQIHRKSRWQGIKPGIQWMKMPKNTILKFIKIETKKDCKI